MSCNGLTSVVIPDSVTTIEQLAFWHCKGLKNVILGRSISKIGKAAFNECGNLREVEFNSENCTFCGKAEYLRYDFNEIKKSYPLVNGSHAFYGFYGIDNNEIKSLNEDEVLGCAFPSNLKILKIGNKVKLIPNDAFWGCSGLTSVEIPNSVTSIGSSAFRGCRGLTSVTIPNSVISIGKSAFAGCSGLTSVTIGNSVTSIGDYAFHNCSNIKNIILPISVTTFGDGVFLGCGSAVDKAYQDWISRAGTQGNEFAKTILDERRQAEAREAEGQRKEKERQKRLRAGAQYVIKAKWGNRNATFYLYPDGSAYAESTANEYVSADWGRGVWKILRRYVGNSFRNYFSISIKNKGDGFPSVTGVYGDFYMFVNGDKLWKGTDSFNQLTGGSPAVIEKLK